LATFPKRIKPLRTDFANDDFYGNQTKKIIEVRHILGDARNFIRGGELTAASGVSEILSGIAGGRGERKDRAKCLGYVFFRSYA
jgi:hypothetical protein